MVPHLCEAQCGIGNNLDRLFVFPPPFAHLIPEAAFKVGFYKRVNRHRQAILVLTHEEIDVVFDLVD